MDIETITAEQLEEIKWAISRVNSKDYSNLEFLQNNQGKIIMFNAYGCTFSEIYVFMTDQHCVFQYGIENFQGREITAYFIDQFPINSFKNAFGLQ